MPFLFRLRFTTGTRGISLNLLKGFDGHSYGINIIKNNKELSNGLGL